MPRSPTEAKPAADAKLRAESRILALPVRAPGVFALCAVVFYALLCLPVLATHRFDPSVFVGAGDRYVTAAQTHPRLLVKTASDGYDGQFYYRMAVAPFFLGPAADGIVFDHPAKRLQRFLYPLLAWVAAMGRPEAAAWSMVLVNLAGIAAIAAGAAAIVRRLALPCAAAWAIILWPGLIVALTHDTTEIISVAFLLWAIWAYLAGLLVPYAVLAAGATLARETTLPIFAGLLAWDAWRGAGPAKDRKAIMRCAATVLAVLSFAAWHVVLGHLAHEAPQAQAMAQDIGLPFLGAARMLWDCVTGARAWASTPVKDAAIRTMVLATAPVILVLCGRVASGLPVAFRRPDTAPLAAAWVVVACLASLLTAHGPWIDPIAYFRAFSECCVLGYLVLFTNFHARKATFVVAAAELGLVWALCLLKLRAS